MDIPRLHPDTIEEVKQRVDILDVISEYVVLRKRGKDYLGLCPFHGEKTPSFTVSPTKQLYYCFGCGAGGNAIKFLMESNKSSFSEVVLDLARRYQIAVKTLEPEQKQEFQRQLSLREQLYEILAVADNFYQHALKQPQGKTALEYLQQERRLSEETIQQFQLGYAPGGWETLARYLVEQKRYSVALVEQAGLIQKRKSGEGYYDRFRDRLMIPIQDIQGRIIGFGSRTLIADEQPKYLNSPETPLFDKSKILFALDKARHSISKEDCAIVVEGYFDAIALHSVGITNAVASMGTAFSQDQLKQLLRYSESKQVIFNFDADSAGTQATQRAISEIEALVYAGQVQLRVLNLPDGKDADEFLKSSADAAQNYRYSLSSAPFWLQWQIDRLLVDRNLKQVDEFQQVAQQMINLLNRIEDSNQRTHYIGYCAQLLSQGDNRLIPLHTNNLFNQLKKPNLRSGDTKNKSSSVIVPTNGENSLLERAESLLLLIYLHSPERREEIIYTLEAKDLLFTLSQHRFLWQQIVEVENISRQKPGNLGDRLISLLQERCVDFFDQIAQIQHLFYLNEQTREDLDRANLLIRSAIAAMEKVACEKYRRYCLSQLQEIDPTQETKLGWHYWQELEKTEQKIKQLEKERLFSNLEVFGAR